MPKNGEEEEEEEEGWERNFSERKQHRLASGLPGQVASGTLPSEAVKAVRGATSSEYMVLATLLHGEQLHLSEH